MKTGEKILIGLAAVGVTLTGVLVANQFLNQPVPIAPVGPARVPRNKVPLYNVVDWFGVEGRAGQDHPTWNEQHVATPELVGGVTGASLGKGLGPAQPPSIRATTPTMLGGVQGYNTTAAGPAGNRVPLGPALF